MSSDLHEYREVVPDESDCGNKATQFRSSFRSSRRFKSYGRKMLSKKPKNIEWLTQLAQPRQRSMKYTEELALDEKRKARRKRVQDLPEPENMDFILNLAKPLEKNVSKKYVPPEPPKYGAVRESTARIPNLETLIQMAQPLERNVTPRWQPDAPRQYIKYGSLPPPKNLAYIEQLIKQHK